MRNGILRDLGAREMYGIRGECLGLLGKHWQPTLVLAAVGDHWLLWGDHWLLAHLALKMEPS